MEVFESSSSITTQLHQRVLCHSLRALRSGRSGRSGRLSIFVDIKIIIFELLTLLINYFNISIVFAIFLLIRFAPSMLKTSPRGPF